MNLKDGDPMYVSPLIVSSPYMQSLREAQSKPLNAIAVLRQLERFQSGAWSVCGGGVNVALYHLEEFRCRNDLTPERSVQPEPATAPSATVSAPARERRRASGRRSDPE
ncbi:MAG: hypothetical protein KatS3mg058_1134 [Roseiflexus sp.]|nr:MAG: hypothetical protein KatS3mg058_1134 [Roseiflexus sp.]